MMDLHSNNGINPQEPAQYLYNFVDANGNDMTAEVYAETARLQVKDREKALEARARRAAKKVGFIARKSRSQIDNPLVNQGGFQIIDGFSGFPVFGWTFDLSAQDAIDFCTTDVGQGV